MPRKRWVDGRQIKFLLLVFAGAEHQVFDGFAGVFAFFEDELHLFGDGHFDFALAGEAEGGTGGAYTFSNFAAEAIEDFGETAALAEGLTDSPVSAQGSRAGEIRR